MASVIHPDMHILQEAQKVAYGGTGIESIRKAWSAYTSSLAVARPASLIVSDRLIPVPNHPVPVRVYRHARPTGACVIYRVDDLLGVREVVVEGALASAGGVDDAVQRGLVVPVGGERRGGRAEQPGLAFGVEGLCCPGHEA